MQPRGEDNAVRGARYIYLNEDYMAHNSDGYDKINDFNAVKISLANPDKIREQSKGEVKKAETINYRSYKPERDGLFCERIFGPEKDYECSCGKFRGMKFKNMVCDHCGVQVTHNHVRRKRMGHIELAAPVVHIWFFKAASSRLATLLEMRASALEKVVYFQDYVVTDPGTYGIALGTTLKEDKYREECAKAQEQGQEFVAEMGAEAIRKLLKKLDVTKLSEELREELKTTKARQRKKEIMSRLRLVEALKNCPRLNKPEWMVLDVIPVIPPDLRPLVQLESGTFAVSDLNDLYRRIINRNTRLKKLIELNAPDVIVRNEKRMLQQSVDALFDNQRCKRPVLGQSNRALKSLTDMIKGKQGRFRENLLGKRVDYSARSVIVVGPHMRLHQCGLPKTIALELYQPFIIRRLKELGHADTIKSAKKMLERRDDEVWDILEQVIQNHPVLLNRAPTLHRMGIQAFEPMLIEGNAIKLHPLVCKGFNADFDGDQMAVHLPLSLEAQVEAHTLMLSTNNIFSPASGKPIISPSQDIVMGCFYITMDPLPGVVGEGMIFSSIDECMLAYSLGKVHLNARIKVRMPKGRYLKETKDKTGDVTPRVESGKIFETTPGRIIFNQILPDNSPYYNIPQTSKELGRVISDCFELHGRRETIDLLDKMMRLGFEESTKSGLSFGTDDLITPPEKKKIIADTEQKVKDICDACDNGIIQEDVRRAQVLDAWSAANDEITAKMLDTFRNDVHKTEEEARQRGDVKRRKLGYVNPVYLMAYSGARGGNTQIRQLAGMRGLMAKPNGELIEAPVKANFLEGLSVLEYFSSTHGARKGLSDTALKTADSGYMTRKLADVAQNCVVTMADCGAKTGILKKADPEHNIKLSDLIVGRVPVQTIVQSDTDEIIVKAGDLITPEIAAKIDALNLPALMVRSPLTCEAELGVCSRCYGMDLSTSQFVEEGMAVGIIAAQSIGEPGTQLTMRTFHIGGVGQHNAEENQIKTEHAGRIRFDDVDVVVSKKGELRVISSKRNGGVSICNNLNQKRVTYRVPDGAKLLVKEGDVVEKNAVLAEFNPHSKLILARTSGNVRLTGVNDTTAKKEEDPLTGQVYYTISDVKGDFRPQIEIVDPIKQVAGESYQLPAKARLIVVDGSLVERGQELASIPQSAGGTSDITTGLPRVQEIFEARRPKDPAVMCEIDGIVEIQEKRHHGKQVIKVKGKASDGFTEIERDHEIPQGKHILVFTGDEVRRGQPLTDGLLVPQDILAICGEEAVQDYLVQEVQAVYRSQNVTINDKHIEIIIAQMLRRVAIEDGGDTTLLQGDVVDRSELRRRNREVRGCVKIADPGNTTFKAGEIISKELFDMTNEELLAKNPQARPATIGGKPKEAKGKTQILGVTKAAVQSDSFLSAASFQETTKVLTEAALAYKVDHLVGLKENVILGRLIPAGTGFSLYQKGGCRYNGDQVAWPPISPDDPIGSTQLLDDEIRQDADQERIDAQSTPLTTFVDPIQGSDAFIGDEPESEDIRFDPNEDGPLFGDDSLEFNPDGDE